MDWYYAQGNEQRGPVESGALLQLLAKHTLAPSTLVWRHGMPQWLPAEQVRTELDGSGQAMCVECRSFFPAAELMRFKEVHVCAGCKPSFLHKVNRGIALGTGLWRWKRDLLVPAENNLVLGDRCVKCNAPATGLPLKRRFLWHHPALYLMILFPGLLFYAVTAVIVRKRVTLRLPLCDRHRARRRNFQLTAWAIFVAGLLSIAQAAYLQFEGDPAIFMTIGGILCLIVAWTVGALGSRVLTATKITREHVFLRGASPELLAPLPEWVEL